jgi:hypothetical protein
MQNQIGFLFGVLGFDLIFFRFKLLEFYFWWSLNPFEGCINPNLLIAEIMFSIFIFKFNWDPYFVKDCY